ncbi:MAG: hypothetical protein ACI8RT_001504, partial [Candidatus Azotimanducaceae bacterium]
WRVIHGSWLANFTQNLPPHQEQGTLCSLGLLALD